MVGDIKFKYSDLGEIVSMSVELNSLRIKDLKKGGQLELSERTFYTVKTHEGEMDFYPVTTDVVLDTIDKKGENVLLHIADCYVSSDCECGLIIPRLEMILNEKEVDIIECITVLNEFFKVM